MIDSHENESMEANRLPAQQEQESESSRLTIADSHGQLHPDAAARLVAEQGYK